MNIGQPDLPTPGEFFAAIRGFDATVLDYAPSPGLPCLVSAIRDYYEELGVHLESEQVLVTAGGSEALQILMLCILDADSEVMNPEPFYPNYQTIVRAAGGVIRPISTTPECGCRYATPTQLEAACTKRTRAILVSSPGNPTGVVLQPEEMRVLADFAKSHDLYLISDEVYREFVYDGQPPASFAQLEDVSEHLVLIDSVSRRYSACGARIGALLSKNAPLMGQSMQLAQARLSVSALEQYGAAALYACGGKYLADTVPLYRARRDICFEMLPKIQLLYEGHSTWPKKAVLRPWRTMWQF
ncbi:MAG: aminotransferase class I/II-fold pyridoxal phosphate-dependent enzyme [Oscillospiraceae bacterium]|nr:aminotransferase class I/II-fold pyridoxal phosphate-dependent enzyme [Oscillospiraceae bacterium]